MSATSDQTGNAAQVYSRHLEDLLNREYDRMATLIGRGEVIVRTVLSILTVLVAITALIIGASVGIRPHSATWIVLGFASFIGLVALFIASLVQSAPSQILSTDETTIEHMLGHRWIAPSGDDPRRIVAMRVAEAIKSLRKANETRANRATKALYTQFAFIVFVLGAVGMEVILQ